MNYVIKETTSLEDGIHKGEITGVTTNERGEQKYKYIDVLIKPEDTDFEIKYGCPAPKTTLNPKSRIGKLLANFTELEELAEINPEEVLTGKKVSFMTIQKDGFVEVVEDSIKLIQ